MAVPRYLTTTAFLPLLCIAGGALVRIPLAQEPADGSQEPPIEFVLELDGQTAPLLLDKPAEIEIHGKPVKVKLTARPWRSFAFAGLQFRYPRSYAFEADLSEPFLSSWTLDGSNHTITVFKYDIAGAHDDILQSTVHEMTVAYGADNVEQKPVILELAGKELAGTRLEVVVAGIKLRQDLVGFSGKGATYLIIFQDGLTDDGTATEEALRGMEMVRESFVFPD